VNPEGTDIFSPSPVQRRPPPSIYFFPLSSFLGFRVLSLSRLEQIKMGPRGLEMEAMRSLNSFIIQNPPPCKPIMAPPFFPFEFSLFENTFIINPLSNFFPFQLRPLSPQAIQIPVPTPQNPKLKNSSRPGFQSTLPPPFPTFARQTCNFNILFPLAGRIHLESVLLLYFLGAPLLISPQLWICCPSKNCLHVAQLCKVDSSSFFFPSPRGSPPSYLRRFPPFSVA